jgi:uncharacterized membrane protein YqjE
MENDETAASGKGAGLIPGVLAALRSFSALAANRIELAVLELSEVRTNAIKLLLLIVFGAIMAWLALAWWSTLVVLLAWPLMGWKIVAIVAAAFTALSAALFWHARAIVVRGGLSMSATMTELRADRDALL